MIEFIQANAEIILGALLALSELLALIPGVKSNSIFTLIVNAIKSLMPKKSA